MIKTKVAFLEGRLFSSQSELFKYFLNCFQKALIGWKCKLAVSHVNRLYVLWRKRNNVCLLIITRMQLNIKLYY